MRLEQLLTALAVLTITLSGCADSPDGPEPVVDEVLAPLPSTLDAVLETTMNFTGSVVDAAMKFSNDLYEPTMDVSDNGVIYVTGHTIGVDTTGAPVFMSRDDGATWSQLPFTADLTMPGPIHGATPPITDEIFLVAGDDGDLYGVDITAFAFPINAWAGDGAEHVYYNPNGYDRSQSTTTVCGEGTDVGASKASSLNDRPWAAYGDGKLLLVNNPGGGPMEIGVMDVPVTGYGVGGPVIGPQWNLCATGGGWIPGIPDMRDDHFFAVPQVTGPGGDRLYIAMGYAEDINAVQQVDVMNFTSVGGGTSNYGQVAFDQAGSMFVTVRNNTVDKDGAIQHGQIKIAVSTNNGTSFVERTLRTTAPVNSVYIDGNMHGEGALLSWGQVGQDGGTDWYAAHMFVAHDGGAVVKNVNLVFQQGPNPSAHVQGAAAGPDGRAYLVFDHGGAPGDFPLEVRIQQDGPTLPVNLGLTAIDVA